MLAAGGAAAAFVLLAVPGSVAHAASGDPGGSGDVSAAKGLPSFSLPGLPTHSGPVHSVEPTIGPPVVTHSTARSGPGAGSTTSHKRYVSTFTPQAAAPSPTPSSAGPCVPSTETVTTGGGYLELPGIVGTSTAAGHLQALPVASVGPSSMLPPRIDSSSLADLTVVRTADASSPNLAMVANVGDRFACAHLELGPGNGYTSLNYALVNAGLVSENESNGTEYLTVTYTSIRWAYTLPGSTAVHTGSGEIDQRPDTMKANLAHDSKLVISATIALAVIAALFLYLLYRIGKRRNAQRYRARYERRAALRAARLAAERGSFADLTIGHPQQPERFEPVGAVPREAAPTPRREDFARTPVEGTWAPAPVEAEEPAALEEVRTPASAPAEAAPDDAQEELLAVDADVVPGEDEDEVEAAQTQAAVVEDAHAAEVEPGTEVTAAAAAAAEPEPEREAEAEAESAAEQAPESSAQAEAKSEPEAELEPQADAAPGTELEAEAAEPEAVEPDAQAAEPEPQAEPEPAAASEAAAQPEAEPEQEPEAEADLEPEADAESAAEDESADQNGHAPVNGFATRDSAQDSAPEAQATARPEAAEASAEVEPETPPAGGDADERDEHEHLISAD